MPVVESRLHRRSTSSLSLTSLLVLCIAYPVLQRLWRMFIMWRSRLRRLQQQQSKVVTASEESSVPSRVRGERSAPIIPAEVSATSADESLELRAVETDLPLLIQSRLLKHVSFFSVYDVGELSVLGEGMDGPVILARHRRSGRSVAAKLLTDTGGEVPNEVTLYLRLSHPSICRLLQAFLEENGDLWLCMEYCSGGELFEQVAGTSRIVRHGGSVWDTEERVSLLVHQMASALRYIHRMGIVHRDIKLENWVFASPMQERIKLIDFGLAASVVSHEPGSLPRNRKRLTQACGTCYYVAPEVFDIRDDRLVEGEGYGTEVDIWALGVLLYMLISGEPPFEGSSQAAVLSKVATLRFSDRFLSFEGVRWQNVSSKCRDLIARCMELDPKKRLTAAGVQLHPWLIDNARPKHLPRSLAPILHDLRHAGRRFASCRPLAYLCGYLATTIRLPPELWSVLKADFTSLDSSGMFAPRGSISISDVLCYCRVVDDAGLCLANLPLEQDPPDACVQSLDLTGDSCLHFFEYLGAMIAAGRVSVSHSDVSDAFMAFDLDMDGVLSEADISAAAGIDALPNSADSELRLPASSPDVILMALNKPAPRAPDWRHAPIPIPGADLHSRNEGAQQLLRVAHQGLDWRVQRQAAFGDARFVCHARLPTLRRGWGTPDPSPTRTELTDASAMTRPHRGDLCRGHRTPDPSPTRKSSQLFITSGGEVEQFRK